MSGDVENRVFGAVSGLLMASEMFRVLGKGARGYGDTAGMAIVFVKVCSKFVR